MEKDKSVSDRDNLHAEGDENAALDADNAGEEKKEEGDSEDSQDIVWEDLGPKKLTAKEKQILDVDIHRIPLFARPRFLSFRLPKKMLSRAASMATLPRFRRKDKAKHDLPYGSLPPALPAPAAHAHAHAHAPVAGAAVVARREERIAARSNANAASSPSSANTSETQMKHLNLTLGGASRGVSTVELVKIDAKLGIVITGGADRGTRPQVMALTPGGVAQRSDAVCVGDRLRAVNGASTEGLLHHEVLELLRGSEPRVQLELEYDMPESVVSNESVCACPRVVQVELEKEQGSFGFTVRGGACADDTARSRPLTITHIRPGGPTDREGTIKPGDRLLAVDGVRLTRATLAEAHRALTSVQHRAVITIEYDVSVMEAVRAAPGPLLVEVEKPEGAALGLTLSANHGSPVVIESIRQASIAERVGALHVGDQVLAIDDVGVDQMSTAEVSRLLQGCPGPLIRLEIVPATSRRQSDAKRCKATLPPSSSALSTSSCGSGSYNTLGSLYRRRQGSGRPARKHRGHGDGGSATGAGSGSRQDSGAVSASSSQYAVVGATLCHPETVQLTLVADSQGFGVTLTSHGAAEPPGPPLIAHIEPNSPADSCGVLHVGDRLLEVNDQLVEELAAEQAGRLLAEARPQAVLTTEFDVADAVVPSSGTFLVKLVKRGPSLGLVVCAPKSRQLGEPLIVARVKPGSVAHRNGAIEPGDRLLSIDDVSVERMSVAEATERLETGREIVTLRIQKDNLWTDAPDASWVVFTVELERHGGALGLTISGTEEPFDPIFISALNEGGLVERTGALHVGDRVLAINGSSLRGRPLSEAIQLLQTSGDVVRMKIAKTSANRCTARSESGLSGSGCREPTGTGSALASVDSAVESWDSGAGADLPRLRLPTGAASGAAGPGSTSGADSVDGRGKRASGSGPCGERWESGSHRPQSAADDTEPEDDWNKELAEMEQVEALQRDFDEHRIDDASALSRHVNARAVCVKPPRQPNWSTDKSPVILHEAHQTESELGGATFARARDEARGAASAPEFRLPCSYTALSRDSRHAGPVQFHRVTLFKDAVYEDFGFSLSNALYEKGVFVNRVKPGGPADKSGILRPYDRILQVNGTDVRDHDCCHIVPLIASVGDRLELLIARNPLADQRPQLVEETGVVRRPWVEDDDKIEPCPVDPTASPDLDHSL